MRGAVPMTSLRRKWCPDGCGKKVYLEYTPEGHVWRCQRCQGAFNGEELRVCNGASLIKGAV